MTLTAVKVFLWLSVGAVATVLSLWFLDQPLSLWAAEPHRENLRLYAREITEVGLGEHWFLLALILYVFSRWVSPRLKNHGARAAVVENLRRFSVYLFFGLLGSGIVLRILKWLFGRQRPHLSDGADHLVFDPLTHHWHFHSLPSGHTQVLFAVATTLILLWPKQKILIYGLAVFFSLTRIFTMQHFLSDVILGALIGVVGTLLVHQWLPRKWPAPQPFSLKNSTSR